MVKGGGPWTAAALAQVVPRYAAGPWSVRRPPVPWPAPPPAPRGARGQTAEWIGEVEVGQVPRPPAARPTSRPPPAPRGTCALSTMLSAAPCAAVPEKGREETVEVEVERPMCLKRGLGGGDLKISVFVFAKYGFSMDWQGAGWGDHRSPPLPDQDPFAPGAPETFPGFCWFFKFSPLPSSGSVR